MKFAARHVAAIAVFGAFPLLTCAQDTALPAAPSAVAQARDAHANRPEILFNSNVSFATPATPTRLNSEQKFSSFVEQSMSPYVTFSSAIAAGFHPSWSNSQYSETYASRMGMAMADQTRQGFFTKFLLPTAMHQDPRYYQSDQSGMVGRGAYALSRVVIGRTDNGKATLNTSELLGAVIAASLTSAYHPYRRYTPGETASRAAAGIGTDAGLNMLREFWPDIRDSLLDHGPKIMQSLVTRIGPRLQSASATSPN